MGLSTVAAACDQNGLSVANAADSREVVGAGSATAGPAPDQEKQVQTTTQNQIKSDEPDNGAADGAPDIVFSLRTGISGSRLVFIGDGGAIDGEINPDLIVKSGELVEVTLVNGDGASLVHRYSADGELLQTLDGTDEAGLFNCPHRIFIDYRGADPELLVAERSNHRVQIFDLEGKFKRVLVKEF
jgi:hypothetical protein